VSRDSDEHSLLPTRCCYPHLLIVVVLVRSPCCSAFCEAEHRVRPFRAIAKDGTTEKYNARSLFLLTAFCWSRRINKKIAPHSAHSHHWSKEPRYWIVEQGIVRLFVLSVSAVRSIGGQGVLQQMIDDTDETNRIRLKCRRNLEKTRLSGQT
jgi:hypothetical protein